MNEPKDTIEILYGEKSGLLPRQPVTDVLRKLVAPPRGRISKRWLMNLVEARQETLNDAPFESVDKFEEYAMKTQGSLMFGTLEGMGVFRDSADSKLQKETVERIYHVGESLAKAIAYMSLIKSIAPLAGSHTVLLPSSLLMEYDLKKEDIIRGEESEFLERFYFHIGDMCKEHLMEAQQWRYRVPANIKPAFLGAVAVRRFLLKFADLKADVYDSDLQQRDAMLPLRMLYERMWRSY